MTPPSLSDYSIRLYLIVSAAHGRLDLVLRDTITAIDEIAYGTVAINRYRYQIED